MRTCSWILTATLAATALYAPPLIAADSDPGGGKGGKKTLYRAEILGSRWPLGDFLVETDVGETPEERKKYAQRIMKPVLESVEFFRGVYQLKPTAFADYAKMYSNGDPTTFDPLVRLRVWRRYDDFLKDYQFRYETKSIPGAFFGINEHKVIETDGAKTKTGTWYRECATAAEGKTDAEVLRSLYHELGHLFMQTFMIHQVEVPSWMEEGTAQLFEYRIGNGTNPEAERDQFSGWLVEMCSGGTSIPWSDFTRVRNLDNLEFTHANPLRSTVQYAQAWSVMEFMIGTKKRQEAFTKLLQDFKSEAKKAVESAQQAGLKGEAYWAKVQPAIYPLQDGIFKKHYGADLLGVEDLWKKWVREQYDKQVKTKPILRYHRGEWHVGYVARHAKTPADKAAAVATAEAIFEECIRESPTMPEGYVGLGRVLMERGKMEEAGKRFDEALKMGGDSFDALLYGGIARVRSDRAAEAVEPLTRAADKRPTSSYVHFYLGQALAVSGGDADKAVEHLKKCRDLDPSEGPDCSRIEGAVHWKAGRADRAFIAWLRAWNANQGDQLLTLFLAMCKASSNETDEALGFLAKLGKDRVAQHLAELIKGGKPMPEVVWEQGWPTIDFNGGKGGKAKDGGKGGGGQGDDAGTGGNVFDR